MQGVVIRQQVQHSDGSVSKKRSSCTSKVSIVPETPVSAPLETFVLYRYIKRRRCRSFAIYAVQSTSVTKALTHSTVSFFPYYRPRHPGWILEDQPSYVRRSPPASPSLERLSVCLLPFSRSSSESRRLQPPQAAR